MLVLADKVLYDMYKIYSHNIYRGLLITVKFAF